MVFWITQRTYYTLNSQIKAEKVDSNIVCFFLCVYIGVVAELEVCLIRLVKK